MGKCIADAFTKSSEGFDGGVSIAGLFAFGDGVDIFWFQSCCRMTGGICGIETLDGADADAFFGDRSWIKFTAK